MRSISQQSWHHLAACRISTCTWWVRTCSFFPQWGIFFACMYYFPSGAVVKNLPANAGDSGDVGSIPVERSPGGGDGNPLQYFHLENPMDRGAWWAMVHRVSKNQAQLKRLSTHHILQNDRHKSSNHLFPSTGISISWTIFFILNSCKFLFYN